MKRKLTDEEVEQEIERLRNSEAVKLARKEENIKNRRRQTLYQLRCNERRGLELMKMGYRLDNISYLMGMEEEFYE